jgi:ankyrin repeat protein/uncharacterized protein YecT (DUF1311 family)
MMPHTVIYGNADRQISLVRCFAIAAACCALLVVSVAARSETPAEHAMALVESEDLQKIGDYLAQPGIGINDRPGDVKTLLDSAAEQNRVKVAEYLLNHGADVNTLTQRGSDRLVNNPGVSPLCRAAYFNSLDVMELLLSHGAVVNSAQGTQSPLICAAVQGNLKAVEVLVERGAAVNHEYGLYQTASSMAIQQKHVEVAQYLLSHGASLQPGDVNYAAIAGSPELVDMALAGHPTQDMLNLALASAAANSRTDEPSRQRMLESLLAHGAAPDAAQNGLPNGVMTRAFSADTAAFLLDHGANSTRKLTGFDLAAAFVCTDANKNPLPLLQMLVARHLDFTSPGAARVSPLGCATQAGRIDVIDYLVDYGASVTWPDWNGFAPIFYAKTRIVAEDLLRHGADLNQAAQEHRPDGSLQPIPRITPLSTAIQNGQWETMALLVSMGADVHARGGVYLAAVAVSGPVDMVAVLLDAGVDVNALNDGNETALMAAVRAERQDRMQLLFDHGADANVRNRMGRTALHLAVEAGNIEIVKLLIEHGADRSITYDEGITALAEARTADLRQLLAGPGAANLADGISARDRADCATALSVALQTASPDGSRPPVHDPGEDWDYLDQAGEAGPISVAGRSYLRAISYEAGYLARVDTDGIERIVCEYGKDAKRGAALRPLTEYERLQARAKRDFKSVSFESAQLQGLRGAVAILEASRRSGDPVPLQFNSDANLLGEAALFHRDDILAYYLDHGVDPNLKSLDHPAADGGRGSREPVAPLFTSVLSGSERSVELLLAHGAQPDAADSQDLPGRPAIAVAVLNRSPNVVEALLAHGANPDIPPGPVPPSGLGIYRLFNNALGGQVDQWVHGIIFNSKQPAHDLVSTATVMFRHGAAPDPWLYTVLAELELWSRQVSLPAELRAGVATSPDSGQVRKVSDGIRASLPPVAGLLDVALRYRDAPPCDASTASEELQYCLPKSLHSADAELNARYTHLLLQAKGTDGAALRSAQRNWIRQRDKSCGVEEITGATEAGWLAYVLSDIAKAQCVLQHTRERVTALQTQ